MPGGPSEKDTCHEYVLPLLKTAGWGDDQIVEQYPITAGRVITVGKKHRRGDALRADYVLEFEPGVPVAVVEAKREYAIPGKGLQQAKNYAQLLDLPFAYSTNGKGIVEDDRDTGIENDKLTAFPSPAQMWTRYRAWKGIVEDPVAEGLLLPFNRALRNPDGSVKEPRYYQRTAINRSVEAILRGDKRLLLTLATGTGKTYVSMQIVWKLWKSSWRGDRNPRKPSAKPASNLGSARPISGGPSEPCTPTPVRHLPTRCPGAARPRGRARHAHEHWSQRRHMARRSEQCSESDTVVAARG